MQLFQIKALLPQILQQKGSRDSTQSQKGPELILSSFWPRNSTWNSPGLSVCLHQRDFLVPVDMSRMCTCLFIFSLCIRDSFSLLWVPSTFLLIGLSSCAFSKIQAPVLTLLHSIVGYLDNLLLGGTVDICLSQQCDSGLKKVWFGPELPKVSIDALLSLEGSGLYPRHSSSKCFFPPWHRVVFRLVAQESSCRIVEILLISWGILNGCQPHGLGKSSRHLVGAGDLEALGISSPGHHHRAAGNLVVPTALDILTGGPSNQAPVGQCHGRGKHQPSRRNKMSCCNKRG